MNNAWDDAMGQVALLMAVGALIGVVAIAGAAVFLCYTGYEAYQKRNDPPLTGPWSDHGEFSLEFGEGIQFGEAFSWN